MTHPDDVEDVLAAFAVEPIHDKATLQRYLVAYPHLSSELLDLALDLEFHVADESPLDLDSPVVAASWARFSQSKPLTAASFTKGVAASLNVKPGVVIQLRDRGVIFASIPRGFLARIAAAVEAGIAEVTSYLGVPRNLASGARYKADGKPAAAEQMTLEEVLRQCGHSPEEISKIIDED